MADAAILSVAGLSTAFATDEGIVSVVDGVSFELAAGTTLGIVGESGCGKSVTALSIMGLLPKPAGRVTSGRILFKGEDLLALNAEEYQRIRGNRIAMIFQEPMTALNPVQRIGRQLIETLDLHRPELSKREKTAAAVDLLDRVGIPAPDQRLRDYPHQLSGGMRQRVLIAIALACRPDVLIADEPTTALDVTIQAQILELMRELQQEYGMGILFITHDLGVIAELCDEVVVMYAGRVVERAGAAALFANPRHPYSEGLLASIPRLDSAPKTQLTTIPGMVPALSDMPDGCRFRNRCARASARCQVEPTLARTGAKAGDGQVVACHHPVGAIE